MGVALLWAQLQHKELCAVERRPRWREVREAGGSAKWRTSPTRSAQLENKAVQRETCQPYNAGRVGGDKSKHASCPAALQGMGCNEHFGT